MNFHRVTVGEVSSAVLLRIAAVGRSMFDLAKALRLPPRWAAGKLGRFLDNGSEHECSTEAGAPRIRVGTGAGNGGDGADGIGLCARSVCAPLQIELGPNFGTAAAQGSSNSRNGKTRVTGRRKATELIELAELPKGPPK